jgi:hypothetical protein
LLNNFSSKSLAIASVRHFGAGHHDHVQFNHKNVRVQQANEKDVAHNIAKTYNFNDTFSAWANGKFPADILTDRLTNDKTKKYSAYNWFGTIPLLQNKLTLAVVRFLFSNNKRPHVRESHGLPEEMVDLGPENNGAKTLFLYHSD